jgi:hypothetical protein
MHSAKAEDIEMVESMQIDVSTLRAATVDFAESNKLGEGGFGTVYKVVTSNHACNVRAVSVLKMCSRITDWFDELFRASSPTATK